MILAGAVCIDFHFIYGGLPPNTCAVLRPARQKKRKKGWQVRTHILFKKTRIPFFIVINKTIIILLSSAVRMDRKKNLFSLSRNVDSLVAAILGFLLIQLFSRHSGIGISPDSVTYLSTARHLVQGRGFISFEGLPTVDFPLAYPLFLAGISAVSGLDPLQFAPVLNGILFGILLYISGSLMNGFFRTGGWYKRILLTALWMSPALQEVYSMLWSETLFLPEILLFIICLSNYLRQPGRIWWLATVVICALACVTRYAGIFMIPVGCIFIFAASDWRRPGFFRAVFFGFFSALPFLINIFRNQILTGTATGLRPPNNAGIGRIMENMGAVISDWLMITYHPVVEIVLALTAVLIFIVAGFVTYRRDRKSLECIVALTGLFYVLFMTGTALFTRYEPFSNRLLSPLYVLLLWSASAGIPSWLEKRTPAWRMGSGLLLLTCTAVFLHSALKADYEFYDGVKDAGIPGYTEDPFVNEEVTQWVIENKNNFDPQVPIYSNAGDAVYFVTGLTARQLPFTDFPERVQQFLKEKSFYLIWFEDPANLQMPSLDFLLSHKSFRVVKKLNDGIVLATTPAP